MNVVTPVAPAVDGGGAPSATAIASFAEAHVILELAAMAAADTESSLADAVATGTATKSKVFTELYPELVRDQQRYKRAVKKVSTVFSKGVRRSLRRRNSVITYDSNRNVYWVKKTKIKKKHINAHRAYWRLMHFKPTMPPILRPEICTPNCDTVAQQAAKLVADIELVANHA